MVRLPLPNRKPTNQPTNQPTTTTVELYYTSPPPPPLPNHNNSTLGLRHLPYANQRILLLTHSRFDTNKVALILKSLAGDVLHLTRDLTMWLLT